ncbi:MAG: hypothetical protein CVU64_01055 [Deltaproteobacteria bacterium HGW-Deltaproteobacteria-21]|nr:MAG: hypothetical protein CVU64_01055 [Deltaproteobacteria bacterium HGW-Deltaproteobacteria-21]
MSGLTRKNAEKRTRFWWVKEIKRLLDPKIEIIEVDANLEDAVFAKALVEGFEELMKRRRTEGHGE